MCRAWLGEEMCRAWLGQEDDFCRTTPPSPSPFPCRSMTCRRSWNKQFARARTVEYPRRVVFDLRSDAEPDHARMQTTRRNDDFFTLNIHRSIFFEETQILTEL